MARQHIVIVALVIVTVALLLVRQRENWEDRGKRFIASIANDPCIAYTVNSPAYVDKAKRIGCRQYNFEYVPENKTHAMHYGKVFWGIKITESNYNGTVVYFDWDVMPSEDSAKALRNGTILLARDTRNITTNWISFNRGAKDFLQRWMRHTNSPRDYNIEDQKWIHAELASTKYGIIEARLVIKGHCHNKLVDRKACVKSMYGQGPVYNIPWKLITASCTFSIAAFSIAYSCVPVRIYIVAFLLEIIVQYAWLQTYIEHSYASVNQIVGMGRTTKCPTDLRPLWNAEKTKFVVPFDRIYVGDSLVETKKHNTLVLVSNGRKIIKCIKAASSLYPAHQYYLIWYSMLILACVLLYKVVPAWRRPNGTNEGYVKFLNFVHKVDVVQGVCTK